MKFVEFKENVSLYDSNVDVFNQTETSLNLYGCNEASFERWINTQPELEHLTQFTPLSELDEEFEWWYNLKERFEKQETIRFCKKTFPEQGFFETVNENDVVGCLLPEPYGHKLYRVSLYDEKGPITHSSFDRRHDALCYLVRNHCITIKKGALDALTDTCSWRRGVIMTNWIYQGLSLIEGINRDCHLPDVQELFNHKQDHKQDVVSFK